MSAISWKFDQDGDWGKVTNWKPSRAPVSTDNVTIDTADFHTVTFSSGTSTIHALTVGNDLLLITGGTLQVAGAASFANGLTMMLGGTLELDAASTIAGLFTADEGQLSGTGTVTITGDTSFSGHFDNNIFVMAGTGTTVLEGTTQLQSGSDDGQLYLDGGRTLENKGLFIDTNGTDISIGINPIDQTRVGGGVVQNDIGATMVFNAGPDGSGGVFDDLSGGTVAFTNAGLIQHIGAGTTGFGIDFVNTGMVQVRQGELDFDDNGTSAVSGIAILSGATLGINGQSPGNHAPFLLTGGGKLGSAHSAIDLFDTNLEITGTTQILSDFQFESGTLTLDADTAINQFHALENLTIANNAVLTLIGAPSFGGNEELITGDGMTVLRDATAMGAELLALDGGQVLRNVGTMDMHANGSIELGSNPFATALGGGVFENAAHGTILYDGQFIASIVGGTGATTFSNDGMVEITGAGVFIDANFVNNGTVSLQANELEMRGAMAGHGTVTAAAGTTFLLEASDTATSNRVDVASGTGHVELTGGSANDAFAFGGNFGASDKMDGGAGSDSLTLAGDYSSGLTLGATTMINIERLGFGDGFNYSVTSNDADVAAGATLVVDASALGAGHALTFNGSAETDGHFVFASGLGGDNFTGGALLDKFVYTTAAQSTSTSYDTINGFGFQQDRVDLHGLALPTVIDAAVPGGALDSGTNFDSELATALTGHLTAHGAMLFTADSGTLSGQSFLIVDLNGTAGYQSGADLVVHMVAASGHLVVNDFI